MNKKEVVKQGESGWTKYVDSGRNGIYIKSKNKEIYYGPFKTQGHAEFFNYLAFVSPTSVDALSECKQGIINIQQEDFTKLGAKNIQFLHPRGIYFESSPAGHWWESIYGNKLTEKIAVALANECGANGYESFRKWLINGSKISGKSAHQL